MPVIGSNTIQETEYVSSYGIGEIYLGTTLVQTSNNPNPFIRALGGTITTSGSYKIHTYTTVGTSSFDIVAIGSGSTNNSIEYLVVAGGGSGGLKSNLADGGGAGGLLTGSFIPISASSNSFIVGAGGIGATNTAPNTTGSNSSALGFITFGGGKGAHINFSDDPARNGGSGAGNGTAISASQGNNGGVSFLNSGASGGGGASQAGQEGNAIGSPLYSGNGGSGSLSSISGTSTYYAGGGGGGGQAGDFANRNPGTGGIGGGGDGGSYTGTVAARSGKDATNYGSAGGGAGQFADGVEGGDGYQGIVIVRYLYQ